MGHTNNYFYKINGNEFRSPLAIMNGIPKSPLNRYNRVTDVVVAYNSWVDCNTPWQISVGANIDKSDYGPDWFSSASKKRRSNVVEIPPGESDLPGRVADAGEHDILELAPGEYELTESLVIDKPVTIRAKGQGVHLNYRGAAGTPAILLTGGGNLNIQNIELTGQDRQMAFATKPDSMFKAYQLKVNHCRIGRFDHVLLGYKGSFADTIRC